MGYLPDTNDHAGWVVHRSGDLALEEAEQLLLEAEELAAAAAKKLATALAADQKSHRTTTPEVALAEAEADAHAAGSLAASAERLAASAEELKAVAAAVKTKKNRSMAAAKQAAAPAPATEEKEMNCAAGAAATCLLFFLIMGSAGGIAHLIMMSPSGGGAGPDDQPEYPFNYSAAINSVSGLDATADHGLSSSLDPSFNLTLRVTSTSPQRKSCVEPGMYMEVSYRRVVLATSPTTQEQLCVGPKEAMDQRIVAKGVGVRVAGAVFDSLMADMRRYVLVFQVTLRRADKHADDVVVKSCGGRLVGAGDDLETMCNTPLPLHKSYGDSD